MNNTKGTHEFTEGKLKRRAGGLEEWGFRRFTDDPLFHCATLISVPENPHATSSETWT